MVFRETGAKLLIMILMCMPIKDDRSCVNWKPYQLNISMVQLPGQIFGWLTVYLCCPV